MKLKSRIERLVKELAESDYYETQFLQVLEDCLTRDGNRKFEQIVCYGLGSFCESVDTTSRYQLALLILIHNYLHEGGHLLLPSQPIEIFDPSFQTMDREALLNLSRPHFKLIEENEFCARKLTIESNQKDSCVLFYMPHLDKYLYNNLVGINWDAGCLGQLVILGNSFQEMIDNEPSSKANTELHYLNVLVNNLGASEEQKKCKPKATTPTKSNNKNKGDRALIELSIHGESFKHPDVFNSLAFHLVDSKWLADNNKQIELYHKPSWVCCTEVPEDKWDNE